MLLVSLFNNAYAALPNSFAIRTWAMVECGGVPVHRYVVGMHGDPAARLGVRNHSSSRPRLGQSLRLFACAEGDGGSGSNKGQQRGRA
eukprot:1474266-Pleurochrysis_carterae.AAC.5